MVKCMELGIRYNRSYNDKTEKMLMHETAVNIKGSSEAKCINCGSSITADSEMKSGVVYCCSDCTLTVGLVLFFKRLKQYN